MKNMLPAGLLIFFLIVCSVSAYSYNWTAQSSAGSRAWTGVSSSNDGSRIVAVVSGGYIYTSNNSGVNWTVRSTSGSRSWSGVSSSNDGVKLAATVSGGYIYTSNNSGVNWTARTNSTSQTWYSVVSSSDGLKLFAGSAHYLYTSNDSGVTWVSRSSAGNKKWGAIASSSDGSRLIASATTGAGYLYISNDSGATWTSHGSSAKWAAVASSSDGSKLVAAVSGGYIYTSNNSGATWTARTGSGSRTWSSVASSSDGVNIVAAVNSGYIYVSGDSGNTWTEQTTAGSRAWSSVASSSNGSRFVAVANGGYIYTAVQTPPCIENWTLHVSACSANMRLKTYTDSNSCGTRANLPSDNGTLSHCVMTHYTYGLSTDLSSVLDFSNVSSLTVDTLYSRIVFNNNVDISSVNYLDDVLVVSSGMVSADVSSIPSMNTSASLRFNISSVPYTDCANFTLFYSDGFYWDRSDMISGSIPVADSSDLGKDCKYSYLCSNVACSGGVFSVTALHLGSFALGTITGQPCVEDWTRSVSSCVANSRQISYTDANSCRTYVNLPSDNGTYGYCGDRIFFTDDAESGSLTDQWSLDYGNAFYSAVNGHLSTHSIQMDDSSGNFCVLSHDMSSLAGNFTTPFTVSSWVYIDDFSGIGTMALMYGQSYYEGLGVGVFSSLDPEHWVVFNDGSSTVTGKLMTTGWHHLVLNVTDFSSSMADVYIDDELVISGIGSNYLNANKVFAVFDMTGPDFNDTFDDVKVSSYVP